MDPEDTYKQPTIRADRAGEVMALQTPDEPEAVHHEMDYLHGAIDSAEELLTTLLDRLRAVLRPEGPEAMLKQDHVAPVLSPVASRILSQRLRVNDLSDRMRDALTRLEV